MRCNMPYVAVSAKIAGLMARWPTSFYVGYSWGCLLPVQNDNTYDPITWDAVELWGS
jgi:hypothetical protein